MWDRSILAAGTIRKASIYDPNLTERQIQQMEMDCLTRGIGTPIHTEICHLRKFFRRMDEDIGASDGQKTPYILVQYNHTGDVHGYPISVEGLRRAGAEI